MHFRHLKNQGYSLIETMIAVSIFAIVLVVVVNTLIVAQSAARKISLERAAMENVSLALESMTKKIREGKIFHCKTDTQGHNFNSGEPKDCSNGGTKLAFLGSNDEHYVFRYIKEDEVVQIYEHPSVFPNTKDDINYLPLTSPDIEVKSLKFYVTGSSDADDLQPFITITITGIARFGGEEDLTTDFRVQTSVSPRFLDV